MINWLREKFKTSLSALFVLVVIFNGIFGAVLGYIIAPIFDGNADFGIFIGLVIGALIGIMSGIFAFGLGATIIHIADTNDLILKKLCATDSEISNEPDTTTESESTENTVKEEIKYNDKNEWLCPKCHAPNFITDKKCFCGYTREITN